MASRYSFVRRRVLAAIGYVEVRPEAESVWSRGWNDAKAGWLDWRFVVLDAIGIPVIAVLTDVWVPLTVAFASFILVWIGATASAPIRQRNEVWEALAARLDIQETLKEASILLTMATHIRYELTRVHMMC